MSKSGRNERAKEKIEEVFYLCPLCSAENPFKITRFAQGVRCESCKAEWGSIQLSGDEDLVSLTLVKAGKNRDLKPLVGQTKSVHWWQNVRSDPQCLEIDDLVNQLLLEAYKHRDEDDGDLAAAMERLGNLGPLGQAEIAGRANGIHAGESFFALWYLARIGDERWIDHLGSDLANPNEEIRLQAIVKGIYLQSQTGNSQLLPNLLETLRNDPSPAVRVAAARALPSVGSAAGVIEALEEALDDQGRPPTSLIGAGSWLQAAKMSQPKASVGATALYALASIEDPHAADIVVSHELHSAQKAQISQKLFEILGTRALEPLLKAAKDGHFALKARAAVFLSYVEDPRSVDALLELLSHKHPNVRNNAAYGLMELGDPRAVKPIEELIEIEADPMVKKMAETALWKLRHGQSS